MHEEDYEKILPRYAQAFPDDAKLIEQFQQGDKSVFDKLVVRYHDRTYRLAQRFVPNSEDALDITQDAFIRAYQGLPDFKRKSQFIAGSTALLSIFALIFCVRMLGAKR